VAESLFLSPWFCGGAGKTRGWGRGPGGPTPPFVKHDPQKPPGPMGPRVFLKGPFCLGKMVRGVRAQKSGEVGFDRRAPLKTGPDQLAPHPTQINLVRLFKKKHKIIPSPRGAPNPSLLKQGSAGKNSNARAPWGPFWIDRRCNERPPLGVGGVGFQFSVAVCKIPSQPPLENLVLPPKLTFFKTNAPWFPKFKPGRAPIKAPPPPPWPRKKNGEPPVPRTNRAA